MKYKRNAADPCLHFKWTVFGLVIWLSWVDDHFNTGSDEAMKEAKVQMMSRFKCDDVGNLKEYVGCKIEHNYDEGVCTWMNYNQPVLIPSFKYDFELPEGRAPVTSAEPGHILEHVSPQNWVPQSVQKMYRSGVSKMLHMMRWKMPETINDVRELSK